MFVQHVISMHHIFPWCLNTPQKCNFSSQQQGCECIFDFLFLLMYPESTEEQQRLGPKQTQPDKCVRPSLGEAGNNGKERSTNCSRSKWKIRQCRWNLNLESPVTQYSVPAEPVPRCNQFRNKFHCVVWLDCLRRTKNPKHHSLQCKRIPQENQNTVTAQHLCAPRLKVNAAE